MSKAEEFIKAKTRIGSNTTKGWRRNGVSIPSYSIPWLTPDQAKEAVEIAREEMIEKVYKYLYEHLFELWEASCPTIDDFMEKFKQEMKDE